MEEISEVNENQNLNDNVNQHKVFYKAKRTFGSDSRKAHKRVTSQILSNQSKKGAKYLKKCKQKKIIHNDYGNLHIEHKMRLVNTFKSEITGSSSIELTNLFDASSETVNNIPASSSLEVDMPNEKIHTKLIVNDTDTCQQKLEINDESDFSNCANESKEINLNQNANDFETNLSTLKKSKSKYFSILNCITPSEIFIDCIKYIGKTSNKYIVQHCEKIRKAKLLISQNKSYASVFELYFNNLIMQQEEFDVYVNGQKQKLNSIYDNDAEIVFEKADKIKLEIDNECLLFQKSLSAYAYKTDILDAVKENQVVLIFADNSYFFNVVTPTVIQAEMCDYFVISCESNYLSISSLKSLIRQSTEVNFMTEEEMLKFLCKNLSVESKLVVIFNIPLKRSINSDLALSVLRDLLLQKEDSRLILLLSVFEDVDKYQKYFSFLRLTILRVPQLILPVKTVWKKELLTNLKNCIDEIVCTVLSVHILNEPGDVLAFLPSVDDAKTAIAIFNKKIENLNYDSVKCVLLHENISDNSFSTTKCHSKQKNRTIYFSTCVAETILIKSVKYIIDCGLKRDYVFDREKCLDVMTIVFNSRAKAKLRKSLAGIYSTGICYRIFSKGNFCHDMQSFEKPDILTLNPFNSFVRLFHYQPENVMSHQFIEPLDDILQHYSVIQLNNFNIVKNEKLTQLGKKIIKLLLPVRYSKLILQGIQWGFAFEAVILVAYFTTNRNVLQCKNDEDEVNSFKFKLAELNSDALFFLHIFKAWIENNYSDLWCDKYQIDVNVLKDVKIKIDYICQHVHECLHETISQIFSEDEDSTSSILKMLFQCFSDNLCVFSGHYGSGYIILSSHHTAFLDPLSLFHKKKDLPQFIIFNKIVCTNRSYLADITAVPYEMVLSCLEAKTLEFNYSDLFEQTLVSKVIEPVNEEIIKEILLRKAEKIIEIENFIKKTVNSELLVIEVSVEKRCLYVYALETIINYAIAIIENILKSKLCIDNINLEQICLLQLKKGKKTVPIELKCKMGLKILSAKVSNISHELESVQTDFSEKQNNSLKCFINLTWVRRPCNGICYINFNSEEFLKAKKLAGTNFILLESEVYVEISRMSEYQLLITGVPSHAKFSDVDNALRNLVPEVIDINVDLKFSPPFETTERDIEKLKFEIKENCEYANLIDFNIIISKPKNIATEMTAYVDVFDRDDLSSAAEYLSSTFINSFKVTAIPSYQCIIKFTLKIYKALESRLQKELNEFKSYLSDECTNKDPFYFQADIVHKSTVALKLLSNDINVMRQVQRTINELIAGEVLEKNLVKNIHKFFSYHGNMLLRELEKSQNVYILEECKSELIRIYGSIQNCFNVKEYMFKFLENAVNEVTETVVLSSCKGSRILLKSIINEYGVNLKSFIKLCKLQSAVLDIKFFQLRFQGSRESIRTAKEILGQHSSDLDFTAEYYLLSSEYVCPVCSCSAFNLKYQFQRCGHIYCKECILALLECCQFPIQCCAENCFADICIEDIVRIFDNDPERIQKLLHSSLNDFLEENASEIFYCPVPDCFMFFYKNEVSEKLNCPLCENDICTRCNVIYHHGYSCTVEKKKPDYKFKLPELIAENAVVSTLLLGICMGISISSLILICEFFSTTN